MHFGGIPRIPILTLPLPGLKSALEIDLIPFAEIFFTYFSCLVAYYDVMPFGIGDLLAGLSIGIGLVCGYREPADTIATFEIMQFNFVSKMPDQHHFIQCTTHNKSILSKVRIFKCFDKVGYQNRYRKSLQIIHGNPLFKIF